MIKLYGTGISLFVRKVRLVLDYKGIAYEHIPVMPGAEENQQFSQLGKIPFIVDDDFFVSDSSVIVQYIEKKHPDKAVFPTFAAEYARSLWFEEYSDTKLTQILSGGIFFEKVVKPMMGRPTDNDKVEKALKEVPAVFYYLEGNLTNKHFLVGEKFSIADISVFTNLFNYVRAGNRIDANRWPALAAYYERLLQLPVVDELLNKEEKELSALIK